MYRLFSNSPRSSFVPISDLRQRLCNCLVGGRLIRYRVHLRQTRPGSAHHRSQQPTEEPFVRRHVKHHDSDREGTVFEQSPGSSYPFRVHMVMLIDQLADASCPFYLYAELTEARLIGVNGSPQIQTSVIVRLSLDTNRESRKQDNREVLCSVPHKPRF